MQLFNADDEIISREMASNYPRVPCFTWSLKGSAASLAVETVDMPGEGQGLRCSMAGGSFDAVIPFADRASVENAVSVVACCLSEGIPEKVIADGLAELPAGG